MKKYFIFSALFVLVCIAYFLTKSFFHPPKTVDSLIRILLLIHSFIAFVVFLFFIRNRKQHRGRFCVLTMFEGQDDKHIVLKNCLVHFPSQSIIQSTPGGDSFPLRVFMCNIIVAANQVLRGLFIALPQCGSTKEHRPGSAHHPGLAASRGVHRRETLP